MHLSHISKHFRKGGFLLLRTGFIHLIVRICTWVIIHTQLVSASLGKYHLWSSTASLLEACAAQLQHAESSCMLPTTPPNCRKKGAVSRDPTLITSQVRVRELSYRSTLGRIAQVDSQEVHKSSWEGTVRRGTSMQTKRTQSFKLPCSSN